MRKIMLLMMVLCTISFSQAQSNYLYFGDTESQIAEKMKGSIFKFDQKIMLEDGFMIIYTNKDNNRIMLGFYMNSTEGRESICGSVSLTMPRYFYPVKVDEYNDTMIKMCPDVYINRARTHKYEITQEESHIIISVKYII